MIVLECNNDEFLIKSLGFPGKRIAHQRCKGEVVKKVSKSSTAIGIIDEDNKINEPREMKNYEQVSENKTNQGIKLFQRKADKQKKLVQISPYLEHWLLNRAKRNKINPKDYNLPKDPKKLHLYPNIGRNKNFQKFLKKLIDTDPEIQTLKKWIEEALG
jgi:hypothetical protein